ncbi:MAG: fructosamine kinase family protein [Mariprofundaceae bacterium]|nr:fructosamine kinase family protein [Mariprofundaceae bacterium]
MTPPVDTRLAVLDSVDQQYHNHFNMDTMRLSAWVAVTGGSINQSYRLDMGKKSLFIKLHQVQYASMFEAEAAGLQALRETAVIRVPEIYACACDDNFSWLVMAYITLGSHNSVSEKLFAQQLAAMHACMGESFGWFRNNTIGSTAQINTANIDWVNFYREHRLGYQLKLAKEHGFDTSLQDKGERLMADLPAFFTAYEVQPSLLHGDLWAGNHAVDSDGNPVIFDPAVYYGDRETDIAMTELFGGLSRDFYAAYHDAYPLHEGYHVRKGLYNLYHILNHANLFGGSYVRQAETMMDQLLAEY